MALMDKVFPDNMPEGAADQSRRYTAQEAIDALEAAKKARTDEGYRREIAYALHQVVRLYRELEEQPLIVPKKSYRHETFVDSEGVRT